MNNEINDKIYVVFADSEVWCDDFKENVFDLGDLWFTNEDQAERCAEYMNMITIGGYYSVEEVNNGDSIDYKALIEEEERKQKEREANREKEIRFRNVDNYALFKSRVEGCGYGETLKELKKKYADYIEGKE